MWSPRILTAVLIVFLGLLTVPIACGSDDLPKSAQVQNEINAALKPGDPSEKIEAYFNNEREKQPVVRSLAFGYDRFQQRYGASMRSRTSNFHAITIYVNVDVDKKFKSVQVLDTYTGL